MPREREDFIRESNVFDVEQLFILAYEGNKTEPTYFESLKNNPAFKHGIIELISLRRPEDDTNSAPRHIFEKLKNETKDKYNFKNSDEFWMIIDRDRNRDNIPKYFELCQNEGNFYFALSNPCFELWLLLHIKDLNEYSNAELEEIHKNQRVSNNRTYINRTFA